MIHMSDTPNIDELKSHVTRLKSLLDDPHPGLSTWMKMYGDEMKAISDFWNCGELAKRVDSPPRRTIHEVHNDPLFGAGIMKPH